MPDSTAVSSESTGRKLKAISLFDFCRFQKWMTEDPFLQNWSEFFGYYHRPAVCLRFPESALEVQPTRVEDTQNNHRGWRFDGLEVCYPRPLPIDRADALLLTWCWYLDNPPGMEDAKNEYRVKVFDCVPSYGRLAAVLTEMPPLHEEAPESKRVPIETAPLSGTYSLEKIWTDIQGEEHYRPLWRLKTLTLFPAMGQPRLSDVLLNQLSERFASADHDFNLVEAFTAYPENDDEPVVLFMQEVSSDGGYWPNVFEKDPSPSVKERTGG
ncbi:MAG: hypothetical protein K8J08_16910 [Thermoanaerobaculia bacterium]|nr:hypothetical protein [Thermoanaerobaculia bacterium]